MKTIAERVLNAVVPLVRTRLPEGITADYLVDGFLPRNRSFLIAAIDQHVVPLLGRFAANTPMDDLPELWTLAKGATSKAPVAQDGVESPTCS